MRRLAAAGRGQRGGWRALPLRHHADAHLSTETASPHHLRRLRLTRFRALAATDWRPASGFNLIHGANGSGKSSLLEAIYLAATGKSFRTTSLAECAAYGETTFLIQAEIEREGSWDLAVAYAEGERALRLQEKPSTVVAHLALLPLVVWSEAERELVAGPAVVRRRFLDRAALLLKPTRLAEHAELQRALAQKRQLLATRSGKAAASELAAWNDLLAPLIARRARERSEQALALETAAGALLAARGADLPPPRFTYQASPAEALDGTEAVGAALERVASRELERRQPLVGPQRDRLEVVMDSAAARRFASAGERKLLALSLLAGLASVLAAAGREPLVLLDDLDSELDRSRLELALALFSGAAQTIATSSRPEAFGEAPRRARWELVRGQLRGAETLP